MYLGITHLLLEYVGVVLTLGRWVIGHRYRSKCCSSRRIGRQIARFSSGRNRRRKNFVQCISTLNISILSDGCQLLIPGMHSFGSFTSHSLSVLSRLYNLLVIDLLLQQYFSFRSVLLSLLDLLFDLFLTLAVGWCKFETVAIRDHLHFCVGFGACPVLNVQLFHLLPELPLG